MAILRSFMIIIWYCVIIHNFLRISDQFIIDTAGLKKFLKLLGTMKLGNKKNNGYETQVTNKLHQQEL